MSLAVPAHRARGVEEELDLHIEEEQSCQSRTLSTKLSRQILLPKKVTKDFYTFAVCKNAVFFAAVIILLCNVECGSWPEIPTDLRTYRNSLIPSSSVRPCAIFPVTKILLLHFDCHIYISVPYITPHTELQM